MITYIFGAGGHALEVAAVAERAGVIVSGDPRVRFVVRDEAGSRRTRLPFPVITEGEWVDHPRSDPARVIIAIGAGRVRSRIDTAVSQLDIPVEFPNVIDPTAVTLGPIATGIGLIAFPNTYVSTRVQIGRHCHINVGSSLGHEVVLGDFVTISPHVIICGRARIGDQSFIGANSTIIEDVQVAGHSTIGAGSTVIDSLADAGTYVGSPARLILG